MMIRKENSKYISDHITKHKLLYISSNVLFNFTDFIYCLIFSWKLLEYKLWSFRIAFKRKHLILKRTRPMKFYAFLYIHSLKPYGRKHACQILYFRINDFFMNYLYDLYKLLYFVLFTIIHQASCLLLPL